MTATQLHFIEEEDGAMTQHHAFNLRELAAASYTIYFHSDGVTSSLAPGHDSREATITFTEDGFVVAIGTRSRIVFTEVRA